MKKATKHLETTRGESEMAPGKNRRQGEGDAGFRGGSKSAHMHPRVCPAGRSASFLYRAVAFGEFSSLTVHTSNTLRVYRTLQCHLSFTQKGSQIGRAHV